MRIFTRKALKNFWEKHANSEQALKAWYYEVQKADWKEFAEVKAMYPSARRLNDNRIKFYIKGNTFRLIVEVNFAYRIVWIRFVGTHAEYDKINPNTV